MLESTKHRTSIPSTNVYSLRKTWIRVLGTFRSYINKISGRLFRVGNSRVPRRMDEEVQPNVSIPHNKIIHNLENMAKENVPKTREEIFSNGHFEWVKTENEGNLCEFSSFVTENGVEYTLFTDGSRIRTELIGDVVLMHNHPDEILNIRPLDFGNTEVLNHLTTEITQDKYNDFDSRNNSIDTAISLSNNIDPVVAILEKTKKRVEKVTITLNLKIPSPELYSVIKDNFDNTDEILLNSVMDQVQENVLKDALKKELQSIYTKRKKTSN
jgi:hypothetical protein